MRRNILGCMAYMGGLALLLGGASFYYEERVREPDLFVQQVRWFKQPEVQPKVLFLGDSRMAMDINAERLPPGFFNWSYPGETLRQTVLRARHAMAIKPSLRYLVVGLEDITLSQRRADQREAAKYLQFASPRDIARVYPASLRFLLRTAAAYYVPMASISHRRLLVQTAAADIGALFGAPRPVGKTVLACGGFEFAEEVVWPQRVTPELSALAERDIELMLKGNNDSSEMRALLLVFLGEAQARGIEVIGLRSPISEEYRRVASRFRTDTARQYMAGLPLMAMLDFEHLFLDRPELFADPDHLNHQGARLFTGKVVAALRRLFEVPLAGGLAACDVDAASKDTSRQGRRAGTTVHADRKSP